MRVAFNAQFLQEPRTGTGRYVFNLLQSLGRVDGMTDYLVLSPHEPRAAPDTPSTFRWEVAPAGRVSRGGENLEKVWWEQRTFPLAAKRGDATIMHIPHFASPMRTYGIPTIMTIHDVIGLRLPAYRASPRVQAYTQLVARAAKHARMVVAVS